VTDFEASRRNMLAGIAAAGIAVPVLAACGSDDSVTGATSSGTTDSASPSASPSSSSSGSGDTIPTADIPEGGGKIFASDKIVVTQPVAGEFKAFTAVCTHQGCIVANVKDGTINCTCHGSKFSIEDGSVENGPATKALAEKTVTVTGTTLTVS
jgi:Rieske Fe-S protein